ncbi:MAG: M23 family metallopeptidase [Chloroflexi bacterium]|nr:M23 family metallopeptidase [Chloroflexota bacterium]
MANLGSKSTRGRYFGSIAGAVVIGLALGVCLGLGIVTTWSTLRVAAFVLAPTPTSTPTPTPLPTQTLSPTPTLTPTATRTPTPTLTPRPKATTTPRAITPHFLFGRPLALDAPAPEPAWVYLYGTTELGQYEVHHGVDFDRNPIGVPVFAVGDGVIVSAGDDRQPLCGAQGQTICGRSLNFYGLVVVIRLEQGYRNQTLYALYGHMSRIDVQPGQRVKRGDRIGAVGMTGIAIGPHIQFEMRSGANNYASTRNPMLWIAPLPGRGVLAGRYTDSAGKPIEGAIVDIYRAEEPSKFYRETETYRREDRAGVNADDEFGENWTMSDLPAGEYIVRVPGKQFAQRVSVPAGGLAFVEMAE